MEKNSSDRSLATVAYRYSQACLSQLVRSGVRALVASPGFRNSPLLLAAHKTEGLEVYTSVDERGAGFFAIGLARAQKAPVALLCTSGTAVGNYMPAVMEANHAHVPLIVLTADRPQELVGSGANQCTDQAKIFGEHVRFYSDTSPPVGAAHELMHASFLVGRAVSRSLQPSLGPVHLNIRFREPFLPNAAEIARIPPVSSTQAFTYLGPAMVPSEEQALAVNRMVREARRPLFVLGVGNEEKTLRALAELSARTGIPVAAEAASGLAFCKSGSQPVLIHRADKLFRAMENGEVGAPDLMLRVGGPLTDRAYPKLLASAAVPQIVFEEMGEAREPGFHPSVLIEGNISAWLELRQVWADSFLEQAWAESLMGFSEALEARLGKHLESYSEFTEWHFQRELGAKMGEAAHLFLGNSMPIRDFNSVFPRSGKQIHLHSNRGLSGIDGLIATASGVAAGAKSETHAVLGDLSTLHDLPSLALVSALREKINLTLWIMNNGGGEIFRIVPTAESGGSPEWFTTPQNFDLGALAKAFRISYTRVHDLDSLQSLPAETFSGNGVRLIEVIVQGEANVKIRKLF